MTSYMEIILYITLFIHYLSDFITQTQWQARNKSKSWKALTAHVVCYSFPFITWGWKFYLINAVSHFIIDAGSSRLSRKALEKEDFKSFWIVVGFDQFLHTVILIWALFRFYEPWLIFGDK